MKTHHLIAPLLATVAGGFWISWQENTLTRLEERNRIIKDRLQQFATATQTAAAELTAKTLSEEKDDFALPDGTPDWNLIAGLIMESDTGNGTATNLKAMLKFQRRLMVMSELELEDGLSKIPTLELTEDAIVKLQQSLLQMLAGKNPGKALNLMDGIGTRHNDLFRWTRQSAFEKFAPKDPAAALEWLNLQINDGKLVSKALNPDDQPRLRLESALLGNLMESDPASMEARLAAFSRDERAKLFSNTHHWRRDGKMPVEFLELARRSLDEEQATKVIAQAWAGNHLIALKDVSESLKDLPFSEKERDMIIGRSIDNFLQRNRDSGQDLAMAYEWARKQDPENAGPILAKSLATPGMQGKQLEGNFQKALELTETTRDPSVVREFVDLYTRENQNGWQISSDDFKNPALAGKMREIYETLPGDGE